MKKDIKFSTRMASADRKKIKALAAKAHMSMSDYVTACCLDKRIMVIDEQKELLRQLKGIGSNINRLTVLANMGKVRHYIEGRASVPGSHPYAHGRYASRMRSAGQHWLLVPGVLGRSHV